MNNVTRATPDIISICIKEQCGVKGTGCCIQLCFQADSLSLLFLFHSDLRSFLFCHCVAKHLYIQVGMLVHHLDQVWYSQLSSSYTFGSADIRRCVFQMEDGSLSDIVYSFGYVF